MITQELLTFIAQQLQAGRTREEVAGMLLPQGWELADVNTAFSQVYTNMPHLAPQMPIIQKTIIQNPVSPFEPSSVNPYSPRSESYEPSEKVSGTTLSSLSQPGGEPMRTSSSPVTAYQPATSMTSTPQTATYQPPVTPVQPLNSLAQNQVNYQTPVESTFTTQTPSSTSPAYVGSINQSYTNYPGYSDTLSRVVNPETGADKLRNPTGWFAGIFIFLTTLANILLAYALVASRHVVLEPQKKALLVFGSVIGMTLIGSLVTWLVTRMMSLESRSWGKTFIFTSTVLCSAAIVAYLASTLGGSYGSLILLAILPLTLGLFTFFYRTSWVRSLLATLVYLLVSFLVGGMGVLLLMNIARPTMLQLFEKIGIAQETRQEPIAVIPQGYLNPNVTNPAPVVENQNSINVSGDTTNLVQNNGVITDPLMDLGSTPTAPIVENTQNTQETHSILHNSDLSLIKSILPVEVTIPADKDIDAAYIIPATQYDPVHYRLEYDQNNSVAYLRNLLKKSLETAKYTVTIHETNINHRYIFATKIGQKNVVDMMITLTSLGEKKTHVSLSVRQSEVK